MKIIDITNEIENIEKKAKTENQTILGLIYLDYILPLFPEGLAARDVHATEDLIEEIYKKDYQITKGNCLGFYFSKCFSTSNEISNSLKRYEIAIKEL